MKKFASILLSLSTLAVLSAGAQAATTSSSTSSASASKTITVGASVTPHAVILNHIKSALAKKGYKLKVIVFNDYVQPNVDLESGELDANYFQHQPYLTDFNAKHGTNDLVSAAAIHFEPLGIYAGKTSSLKALKSGATVAVPNDTTNEARALLLLQANGLIKLKSGAGLEATVLDIASNPKKLVIKELEAAQIGRSLKDVDVAVVNGNYAVEAGLKVSNALAIESSKSAAAKTYANLIVVKSANKNSPKIKALVSALKTTDVKNFINKTFKGAVVPVF